MPMLFQEFSLAREGDVGLGGPVTGRLISINTLCHLLEDKSKTEELFVVTSRASLPVFTIAPLPNQIIKK
jgi:hypothetical protein